MKDCSVLLVHDDTDIRETLAEVLRTEGYPVETAAHGADAVEKMKAGYRPDVILSDLLMPVMDGYELNRELKRHEQWSKIPLIVLSAGNPRPGVLEATEVLLQMPIDLDAILARVGKACMGKAGNT